MGRPPQEAAAKPVRARRKRGGTVTMTFNQAWKLVEELTLSEAELHKALSVLDEEGAAYLLVKAELDKATARILAIGSLTVEVPA